MIVTRGLTKRYGRTLAVDDLSFTVSPGVVTGFLGPNGSGKSTTMRMILGLDAPDAGSALVNGCAYAELSWPLREVGALLDAKAFHPGRSARNHLRWLAQTNDLPLARIDTVLDIVGLTAVADRRAGKFSLGMGQRLGIASALLGDPGVLLFDEPVNGLDPEGIRWVRHLLRNLASEGRTVLVSSHLINEMALTAERLVVIGRGTLIADTSVDDFVGRHRSDDAVRIVTPTPQRFVAALVGRGPARRRGRRRHCRLGPVLRRHRRAGGRSATHRARADARTRVAGRRLHGAHQHVGRVPLAHPGPRRRPRADGPLRGPPMTTFALTSVATTAGPASAGTRHWRAGLCQAMRAEWTKLVSLRSTRWTLLVTAVGTLLVTFLSTRSALHHPRGWYQGFDPTNQSMAGLALASLALGVLGVLVISGEYGTGTIRSSLAAVPRRGVLLTAKIAVVGLCALVIGEVLSFVAFFEGQAVLSGGAPTASLGQPGVLRVVALSGAFLALFALLGLGLGAVIRHTAGAIAVFAGFTMLAPVLLHSMSENIARYAPELIFANSVAAVVPQSGSFSATIGVVLMVAYCAAALGLGARVLNRRDA